MPILIREAKATDIQTIHSLICELATFEKSLDEVVATPNDLLQHGFEQDNPLFYCVVAELNNKVVGFALSYFRYSTWKGKVLHLEDLYVLPEERGFGIGQKLLKATAEYALETDCNRMLWEVLDWNAPAIKLYKKIGAEIRSEWLHCRLRTREEISKFIKEVS
jgi:GNAT superfamily N-acetyltransferase